MDASTTAIFPRWRFSIGSACFGLRSKAFQPSWISRFQTDSVPSPLDVNANPAGSSEGNRVLLIRLFFLRFDLNNYESLRAFGVRTTPREPRYRRRRGRHRIF